jgi:stage II sporulation protein AA (anti-sigma F factor antagonist)
MHLDIKFSNRGTTLIVTLAGELDHHYAEHARKKIDNELMKASTRNVILDISTLGFMDSSGIGVIAGRYKNIHKLGGNLCIVSANTRINRILEMSGLLKIIPSFEAMDEAMDHLLHTWAKTKSKGRENKDATY